MLALAGLLITVAGAGTPANAIIGGTGADLAAYPFFARVGDGTDTCGASLVAPDRVITAAHCLSLADIGAKVEVGPDAVERRVTLLATHPVALRLQRDVGAEGVVPADLLLLGLNRPVDSVIPLPVATPEEALTAPGTLATTIGFGANRFNGDGYGTFRSGTVRIQDPETCGEDLVDERWRKWSLCTRDPRLPDPGARRPFVSPCFGDSGGPLLVDPGDGLRLVGTVSFGRFCGTHHDPEVYANAVAARDFILAVEPPWAPKPDGQVRISGRVAVGNRVSCEVEWLVPPDRRTSYFWVVGRQTIPAGRSLRVIREYAGRKLHCVASGRTAGGLTSVRSADERVR